MVLVWTIGFRDGFGRSLFVCYRGYNGRVTSKDMFYRRYNTRVKGIMSSGFSGRGTGRGCGMRRARGRRRPVGGGRRFVTSFHTGRPRQVMCVIVFVVLRVISAVMFVVGMSSCVSRRHSRGLANVVVTTFLRVVTVVFTYTVRGMGTSTGGTFSDCVAGRDHRGAGMDAG